MSRARATTSSGNSRPYGLWVRGDNRLLGDGPTVCVYGARASTSDGNHVAEELAADLTGRGTIIVTGAAYGIEGAATRAALTAGGSPVVILASGLDRPYPSGSAQLIEHVAQPGAVVSEIPPGFGPTRRWFLARNRIFAALSDTVVIPEAGARSRSPRTAAKAPPPPAATASCKKPTPTASPAPPT